MNLSEALKSLPDTTGCVVNLSGGLDSTIAMRICIERYGAHNVRALSFFYGQKQWKELLKAGQSTAFYNVDHKILNLEVLEQISKGFSANVDENIEMPTIKEVLGDPRPKTYVPNRNMILMSIAAGYAETQNIDTIIMGLQVHDEYNYHDTTARFVEKINDVLAENRMIKIKVIAPFSELSKRDELNILRELEGNLNLAAMTHTCYNPVGEYGLACGKCPSCAERIKAFRDIGEQDPILYDMHIKW